MNFSVNIETDGVCAENILTTIIEHLICPHSTWKPSKEQMTTLLGEVKAWTKGCPKQKVLESLYNDLKKYEQNYKLTLNITELPESAQPADGTANPTVRPFGAAD